MKEEKKLKRAKESKKKGREERKKLIVRLSL